MRSIELKEKALRLDAVFEPIDPKEPTYFVEAQFQSDEGFYGRFFSEIFLYLHQYREKVRRWQGVVIYPSQAAEQKDLGAHQEVLARLEPDLIRRIYLDQLPSIEQLETPVGWFRLVIELEQTAPEVARILAARSAESLNIVQQILFAKFAKKSRQEILAMLGITEEILRNTQAFQEILQEGREEGKLEAKLEMVPLLRELGLDDETIAQKLSLPLEKVQSIPKSEARLP